MMKKAISILMALALMICAVVSVSAEISPTASAGNEYISVDTIVGEGIGTSSPDIDNAVKVDVSDKETVVLNATPGDGYKFSHWDVIFGEFEYVEGDMYSAVVVIRPTGNTDVRLEANFITEDQEVTTTPGTKPVYPPSPNPNSPVTGEAIVRLISKLKKV